MPVKNSIITSIVGEGGSVLQQNGKMFLPSPRGYVQSKAKYEKDVKRLLGNYKVGFLPWPIGLDIDNKGKLIEEFTNNHLDRAAAFIKGKDGRDYLLLDPYYYDEAKWPWGSYAREINDACMEIDVKPIVIDKSGTDTPYALNLVQFEDESVFMTNGSPSLKLIVEEIVGSGKVFTTSNPIIYFPILRKGGLRCLTLSIPKSFFTPRN